MLVTMIKSDPKAREKPCLRCGYSLRKLTETNYCPECGLSLWLSLNQNDTLEMSNPDWLRRMVHGLWIMALASVLLTGVFWPPTVDEFRFMQFRQQRTAAIREASMSDDPVKWSKVYTIRPPVQDRRQVQALTVLGGAGFAAYMIGLIVLTSSENRYPDRLAGFRLGARVTCGAAGLALILIMLQIMHPTPLGFPAWLTRLASVAAALLTWGYLSALARRMPNKTLVRCCTWMVVAALLSLAYSFVRNSDWLPNLIPLVYAPVSAGLMIWAARLLSQAATLSEKNWATETHLAEAHGSSPASAKT